MKVRLIPLSSAASPIVSLWGTRCFTAAAGGSVCRSSSWLRITSRPEEFNAPKFPSPKKTEKNQRGKKKPTTLAWFLRARRAGNETAPLGSYELHPQRYVSVIARRSLVAGFLKISSIPWHYYPPVSRHNGAAVWHGRSARARHHGALPRSHRVGCWCSCRSPSSSFFPFPNCFLTLCISAASPLRFSCRTDRRMERTAHARSTHPVCSVLTGVATV